MTPCITPRHSPALSDRVRCPVPASTSRRGATASISAGAAADTSTGRVRDMVRGRGAARRQHPGGTSVRRHSPPSSETGSGIRLQVELARPVQALPPSTGPEPTRPEPTARRGSGPPAERGAPGLCRSSCSRPRARADWSSDSTCCYKPRVPLRARVIRREHWQPGRGDDRSCPRSPPRRLPGPNSGPPTSLCPTQSGQEEAFGGTWQYTGARASTSPSSGPAKTSPSVSDPWRDRRPSRSACRRRSPCWARSGLARAPARTPPPALSPDLSERVVASGCGVRRDR
jgi:hypothetical protein